MNGTGSYRLGRVRPGISALLTVVIDHGFDISEDLTVAPVRFLSCLRKRIDATIGVLKDTMRLGVENEWYG